MTGGGQKGFVRNLPVRMYFTPRFTCGRYLDHENCPFGTRLALAENKNERNRSKESQYMLWTVFLVLVILWALGMVTSYTASGLIHILLVLALVMVVVNLVKGRRVIG